MKTPTVTQVLRENEELRRRLEEVEDTVRAIRAGEVDAVLVGTGPDAVYTLQTATQSYRLLVERVPQGAATVTTAGEIIHANCRFADLLRRPLPGLAGRPLSAFVAPASRPALEALLRDGRTAEARAEVALRRPDGTAVPAYLGVTALREGVLGECLMVTDLTAERQFDELRRTQAALRAATERLELAQQAGRIGTFEWDIRTGAVNWSATEEELYGVPPGTFGGRYESWKQAVHPDDRDRAEADVFRAVADRAELNTEFRIVLPDGRTRWIAARGRVSYAPDGEPLRMLGVNLDVTDRKAAVEELREADRRKDEFLAMLAHELRNPLAPIRHAAEILKAKGPHEPQTEYLRAVIDRQVGVMGRLLDDLLDVSRVSRGRLELRRARIGLAAVIEAALETARPAVEAGGHGLTVSLPADPVYLDADPVRLAQVFANLLHNAAKYTEPGGRIWLTAERRGGEVAITVGDTGIGITPDMLPRIFDIFSQAAPARAQGGLGIGLSLVKGLVELHGGAIEAASPGPGLGSAFVVRLPEAPAAPAPEPPAAAPAPDLVPPRRVLVVDDCRDIADTLAMLLRVAGHDVGTAYDGQQAVEAADRLRPDLVLLDLGMPGVNGYETARRIRAEPWGRGVWLVALTGWAQAEDVRRTREAGFDHHLVKPVDPDALMRLLASLPAAGGPPG